LLRKGFVVPREVERAVVYVVGLGFYKLYINGVKASTHELGTFTNFATRVLYDTLDVTELLQDTGLRSDAGVAHALGVQVVPGWYGQSTVRAGVPSLYLRLSIDFADGSTESIVSGLDWKAAPGPVTQNDIYKGETFDARLLQSGWSEPGFDASAWVAAASVAPPSETVQLTSHAIQPAIAVGRSYTPIKLYESAPGTWVFDFGQNMAVRQPFVWHC